LFWLFWRWSLENYLPDWPQTTILLISASQVGAQVDCFNISIPSHQSLDIEFPQATGQGSCAVGTCCQHR
jgi:hypothetical protein